MAEPRVVEAVITPEPIPATPAVPPDIRVLSRLLDRQFAIPGTQKRFGLDALIGLIPGVGDTIGFVLGAWIILRAKQLGLPRRKLVRMFRKQVFDWFLGLIPIVGDIADALHQANSANLQIIQEHLAEQSELRDASRPG